MGILRIDLGCGSNKHTDCTGIDIKPGESVDLVHDFEQSIPLLDDAVTFVMANRSLEYTRDLLAMMREIYRVCEHKAQICIVAPYSQAALHLANPAIKTYFNEYTPFYLTSRDYRGDLEISLGFVPDYLPEEAPGLGLRLLRMEMFLFSEHLRQSIKPQERKDVRRPFNDIVDEVMYHFIVVKKPVTNLECCVLAAGILEEPKRLTERRIRGILAPAHLQSPQKPYDNPLFIEHTEPAALKSPRIPKKGKPLSTVEKRKGVLKVKKSKPRSRLIRVKSFTREATGPSTIQPDIPVSRVLFDIRDLYIGSARRSTQRSDD